MTEDQDNAGEVVAATVRVALTAAGQLAEQAARRREAVLRDVESQSAAQVATLRAQFAAERQLALGSVRDVLRGGDTAGVEEVAQAWQAIRSWDDQVTVASQEQLRELVRVRFGVEPDTLTGGRARLEDRVRASERDVPAAAAILTQDTAKHQDDAGRLTAGASDRVTAFATRLKDAGINAEVAYARALAAQSHPTSAELAAQRPGTAPRGQHRVAKRRAGVEVQSPGR